MYKIVALIGFFCALSIAVAQSKEDVEYERKLSAAIRLTTNQCESQQVVRVQVSRSSREPVTVVYGQAIKDGDWENYRFVVEGDKVVLQLLESLAEWYKKPPGTPRKVLRTWRRGEACVD
jgi:hypothetical protein